jgi:hypothetical protein
MKNFVDSIYKNQSLIFKVLLFLSTVSLIVYFFPKGSQFKYEIVKNKPWQYKNLYAPFDFPIYKLEKELKQEKSKINKNIKPIFNFDQSIVDQHKKQTEDIVRSNMPDSLSNSTYKMLESYVKLTFKDVYENGIRVDVNRYSNQRLVLLKRGNIIEEVILGSVIKETELRQELVDRIEENNLTDYKPLLLNTFFDLFEVNVTFNEELTQQRINQKLSQISPSKGVVKKGSKIIAKGEIIEDEKYKKLLSLKKEYQSQNWEESSYYVVVGGYTMLVALALLMLMFFIKQYRPEIYDNQNKLTFVFFNILFMVFLTLLVMRLETNYIYIVPLCVLPLTLKAFFDARLGLFTHVITVLILGFIVPNSYEYMFLQIIAGIVTILTVSELYKRANLFISVAQITFVYIFSYLAFNMIQEGSILNIDYENLLLFLLGGLGLLFVQPLIYTYEKLFGLVSDLSLLELSDTNTKLLKQLADVAPGTFHHSLNVANLAESAAYEINANALLVRVGALYHDIGKMKNTLYFSENQPTNTSPHDELPALESAKIIIRHRSDGVEMAKKYNLPDRIIDFIRTHHGTSMVYFFFAKEKENSTEELEEEDFRYPGPKPFSKETAILMMCDSVEAASKSLKEPTAHTIDEFVEKIINKQIDEDQFINANITFKEIQLIKRIIKSKLKNIYHLRVEYPE